MSGQRFEAHTISRILFPVAIVGRDTKSCTSSGFNLVKKKLLSTRKLVRPFVPFPSNRIDDTKSLLLREHQADLQNELFGTRVLCLSNLQEWETTQNVCTMDDANCFHMIRLELKTSVYEMNDTVVSTVTGLDVTSCATTLQGFNKQNLH